MTEVWSAEKWLVPLTTGLSLAVWQAIFGMLFLSVFLTWMYYAFIRPPIFHKRNAKQYAQELYRYIHRGNGDELKIIANELGRSSESLIAIASQAESLPKNENNETKAKKSIPAPLYARDILLLIADRKFCRQVVSSSPVTAQAIFEDTTALKEYRLPLRTFAQNITAEAIKQKESFMYSEATGYESGLMGYIKPVSQAMFSDCETIEAYNPLGLNYKEKYEWDAEQWEAYVRAALIILDNALKYRAISRMRSVHRFFDDLEIAYRDLYTLSDIPNGHSWETTGKLRAAIHFCKEAFNTIDESDYPPQPLVNRGRTKYPQDIYDELAEMIQKICFTAAATVKGSEDSVWSIHYGLIWGPLNQFSTGNSKAGVIVRRKLRRLVYDEVKQLEEYPNFKGARLLGFFLNILGVSEITRTEAGSDDSYPLAKVLKAWTKQHYLSMRKTSPDVAEAVLIGSLSFDEETSQIVKTFHKGTRKEAPKDLLTLNSPDP